MKTNNNTSEAVRFLEWCNTPVATFYGEVGSRLRVSPQAPEYNSYIVIDATGYSILPTGTFLTAEELYEYWDENFNDPKKASKYKKAFDFNFNKCQPLFIKN